MTQDKIEQLKERLQKVVDAFNELKNSGINKEILAIYIKHKTGQSMAEVNKMLSSQEEFYNNLIKEEMLNKMTEDESNEKE